MSANLLGCEVSEKLVFLLWDYSENGEKSVSVFRFFSQKSPVFARRRAFSLHFFFLLKELH